MIDNEIAMRKERCFLVAAVVPGRYADYEEPLAELASLVDTAGGEVTGRMVQHLHRPHPRTFLGKGKFAEMVEAVHAAGADTVVVDDDLQPRQLTVIEDACRRKVVDRSEVILDIFATRARTHQAKLQVELAQAQYELPRLVRKWTHLERLGGGIGTRGPGESQIETDRRLLRRRIATLRRELARIEERRTREVHARHTAFSVCLVGYTNAGKSTLLNRLTGAGALAENKLFATLDTLTRRMALPGGGEVLVSDTVGFIRRLPHHLVASFHATLEEAAQADLLLHVIDAAHPLALRQAEAVRETLRELGMGDKALCHLLNKCDAVSDRGTLANLRECLQPALNVSALTGVGIADVREFLARRAASCSRRVHLRFPATDGRRLALVNALGRVEQTSYENADVCMVACLDAVALGRLRSLPGSMQVVDKGSRGSGAPAFAPVE